MTGEGVFYSADHVLALREESRAGQEKRDDINYATLKGLVGDFIDANWCLILRAKNIGSWLNSQGNTVTGALFPDTEFRNFLCTRYNVTPLKLQSNCNRCGIAFNLPHTLICRKVGLVIARHNEVCDKLLYLV